MDNHISSYDMYMSKHQPCDTSRENRVVKCNSQKAGIKLPEMVIQPRRISDPTNTQQGGIPTISTCGKTNLCDMVD